jgi:lysine biosynthesis protein LysW
MAMEMKKMYQHKIAGGEEFKQIIAEHACPMCDYRFPEIKAREDKWYMQGANEKYNQIINAELVQCPECQVDLEVIIKKQSLYLGTTPAEKEDWGE